MMRMPSLGDDVGRYRLLRELGHGGMGVVYVALDTVLDREVALKVIAPQLAGDEDYRLRFAREAGALSQLDSPHVVAVHDHGEEDGCLYLVTQLVPDGDLLQHLARDGALPPAVAVDVVMQILDGLADAHRAGIVHRDVKPSNVLLRRRDSHLDAFLCDFGVASTPGDQITHTGALVGSFPYMAPERHRGESAGVRGDVYSAGCLLWQTLTGTAPYGGTEVEIALAHLQAPVPQLPGGTGFADVVNAVLARALAKDPEDRFVSARAMRGDLGGALAAGPAQFDLPTHTQIRHSVLPGVLAAQQPEAVAPPTRRRRAAVIASAAVVALVAGAAAVVVATTGSGEPASDVADVADTSSISTGPLDATTGAGDSPSGSNDSRDTERSDRQKSDRQKSDQQKSGQQRGGTGSGTTTVPLVDPPVGKQPRAPRNGQGGNGGNRGSGQQPSQQPNQPGQKPDRAPDRKPDQGRTPPPSNPTQAPAPAPRKNYTCWNGPPAASLRDCDRPVGVAGIQWVFPGYDGCYEAAPSAAQVNKLVCPGTTRNGPIETSFIQWRSVPIALNAQRKRSGRAGSPWRAGWGYQFSEHHPKWKVQYARTFLYDDEPMTVRVEAGNQKSRAVALKRITYRPPSQLRGTHN